MTVPTIQKRPGVCGGDACIRDTRIPVWGLVEMHLDQFDGKEILRDYPSLRPEDLKNAWKYYQNHKQEIDRCIWENHVCMIEHSGTVDADLLWQGRCLGLTDEEIRESFEPPLSQKTVEMA